MNSDVARLVRLGICGIAYLILLLSHLKPYASCNISTWNKRLYECFATPNWRGFPLPHHHHHIGQHSSGLCAWLRFMSSCDIAQWRAAFQQNEIYRETVTVHPLSLHSISLPLVRAAPPVQLFLGMRRFLCDIELCGIFIYFSSGSRKYINPACIEVSHHTSDVSLFVCFHLPAERDGEQSTEVILISW